ncbi:MAG: TIGR02147 family protein [Bdellovibrionota bacterium]
MSVYSHETSRNFLREVMAEKARKNPAFSLRAMAKSLEIAPSFLSGVLKGQKNLSLKTSMDVARRLRLPSEETEYFCLLAQKDAAKDPNVKESLLARLQRHNPAQEVNDLSVDHFRSISDWQHFAILSATEIEGFDPSARNLAAALELPQAEIEVSLDRLERLGMLERDSDGRYRKTKSNPRVVSKAPSQALRNFHRQTLQKAADSLESQTTEEKVVGSETFAIDSDQVQAFNALANEFFDKAIALAKKSKKRDSVYHLGVQFFNFTPSLRRKKKSETQK